MNAHAPPGKETACYDTRRISKLDWAETTATRAPLQACRHPATRTERLPDGHLHFGRLSCAICRRHLRWLPRPIECRTLMGFRIARLAMCSSLSSWERGFLRSVSRARKLSPSQQALVARLVARYLEAEAP